jgi:hypothetical protein
LQGQRLLVEAEPSLCDQIMFASCLPEVISAAGQCIVQCDPRLQWLFARSFPTATIDARPSGQEHAAELPFDVRVACGSLPRYLRRSMSSFPRHQGYLQADETLKQSFRGHLNALGPGLKVGIAWRGGNRGPFDEQRSVSLAQCGRLLSTPGTRFINLQPGECAAELQSLRERHGVQIQAWPERDFLHNLDVQAALIASLDLVITVPTVTAHLAGGLGVEVWNLLAFSSSWRWMVRRDDSPWYPSMRLFRQPVPGDWSEVFSRLEHNLAQRAMFLA